MGSLEHPKLRPLQPFRVEREGRALVGFTDPLALADSSLLVPLELAQVICRHFDGSKSVLEIQAQVMRESGRLLELAGLESVISRLDGALILDGPAFEARGQAYRQERVRPAALAGRSYPATERGLRAQLNFLFSQPTAAGLPQSAMDAPPWMSFTATTADSFHNPPAPEADRGRSGSSVRGIISPHIDFQRGGTTYTWAYRQLLECSEASVFVILGVAHQPTKQRFVLTEKDFQTPLGVARTNRRFVEKIAALAGDHLFEDELVHRTEHSIELQVVFLQHVLGDRRDFTIVPILVGPFHDLMAGGREPIEDREISRFLSALRAAESSSQEKVAYIGGIDLGHIGPEFGDPLPVGPADLEELRGFDNAMLERAAAGDAAGWFACASAVQNRYRVCGLAATYTFLKALGPARGTVLRYEQAVNPPGTCCVSFASVAFRAAEASASASSGSEAPR